MLNPQWRCCKEIHQLWVAGGVGSGDGEGDRPFPSYLISSKNRCTLCRRNAYHCLQTATCSCYSFTQLISHICMFPKSKARGSYKLFRFLLLARIEKVTLKVQSLKSVQRIGVSSCTSLTCLTRCLWNEALFDICIVLYHKRSLRCAGLSSNTCMIFYAKKKWSEWLFSFKHGTTLLISTPVLCGHLCKKGSVCTNFLCLVT